MSKERLEEIKYKLYTLHNCTDTDEAIKDFIFYHLKIELIIEQAERVQELERANKQLEKQAPGIELGLLNVELTDALKQNKRYRKALEEIRNYGTFELNNALKKGYAWIAHEALEEEEK